MSVAALTSCTQRVAPFTSSCRRLGDRSVTPSLSIKCQARDGQDCPKRAVKGDLIESLARGAAALTLAATLGFGAALGPQQLLSAAEAYLPGGDPIKNARALLRYALPINNKPIRQVQVQLEGISEQLRIPGSKPLGAIERAVKRSETILEKDKAKIIADFAPDKKEAGLAALAALSNSLKSFEGVIGAGDKQLIPDAQSDALQYVGQIEEAMVKGFPFSVPAEYANLPQLKGRAEVEMKVEFKDSREEGLTGGTFQIVVDGYNAPVTAGNFIDLVARGFYDNIEVQRADGFVVQFGDPEGPADGFVDPRTQSVRRVPFEVMVSGDKVPVYEETLQDLGRFNEQPVLPFNAYGTMALARGEFEPNSGSSQVFFLLKESELTPTGSNLLDGRYAVFGYIVDNQNLLRDVKVGDRIVSTKVTSGLQFLQEPSEN